MSKNVIKQRSFLLSLIARVGALIILISGIFFYSPKTAQAEINVLVYGNKLVMDTQPVIIEGRILVPLRAIFEALGAEVNWDNATQTVTATKDSTTIIAKISSAQINVNNEIKTLDVPAQIINNRTLVPVRFISESLGAKVDWDEVSKTVVITDEQTPVENLTNLSIPEVTLSKNQGSMQGKNIVNNGYVTQQGDWIYFSNASDKSKLYKIRTDGSERTCLNKDGSKYIIVAGDWIYYANRDDDSKLYKIRTDGSERTRLNNDNSIKICVAGDWIYYVNGDVNESLYKIRTDGSERTFLNEDSSAYINVVGDWIYYANRDDRLYLYKIRTDGSKRTRLNQVSSAYINVADGWIYFANLDDDLKLYKIRTDGSECTRLNNDGSKYIYVAGDWIYYANSDDDLNLYKIINAQGELIYYVNKNFGKSLYKIRTDGSERTCLNNDNIVYINVTGDWIYYVNASYRYKLYKIRTDGSEKQPL